MTAYLKRSGKVSIKTLAGMKASREKIACLTAYDASFSSILDECGIDVILVGDSLGMVIQGNDSTLPVTMDDMIYHTRAVSKTCKHALLIADMPFLSYTSPEEALKNAARFMKEASAHMVKLESSTAQKQVISRLANEGIPVCAHLGLRPQSVYKLGGYIVQGKDQDSAESMLADARAFEEAGADMIILECVPTSLAATITESVNIPVIGIGAGPQCDGQVLVLYDILAITSGKRPKFSKDFMAGNDSIPAAIQTYIQAVKSGQFPKSENSFD